MINKIKISINCVMLFCMTQFLTTCYAQKRCTSCGTAVVKLKYYDTTTKQFIAIPQARDIKMWYKDSCIIQEYLHIFQGKDESQNTTWNTSVEKYKYIDLRTKEIYEYYTFSDTAKPMRKCAANDSDCIRGCWIYRTKNDFVPDVALINMPDTLIDGVRYRRAQTKQASITEKGKFEDILVLYMRCDMKDLFFFFSKQFSLKMGCPLVRFESYTIPALYPGGQGLIDYSPNALSTQELKVFAAWEKNAKEYNKNN